jgi:uncharacterized protein
MIKPLEIIDAHCHVASTRYIPRQFLVDVARNMRRRYAAHGQDIPENKLIDLVLAQNQDHDASELIAEMDGAGISKTVLLMPDFSHAMAVEMDMLQMAHEHRKIADTYPNRFYFFVGADPRNGKGGPDNFISALDIVGGCGLKLYPPCGYSPSDPDLYPYYEICEARGIPVLLHTGPTAQSLSYRHSLPQLIDQAARKFKNVNFILAHGGVTYTQECVELCRHRDNLYMDIGGFTGGIYVQDWMHHLSQLMQCGINHKIIFGTDWPIFRMSGGLKKVLGEFMAPNSYFLQMPLIDQKLIASGNIKRLLNIKQEA